MTPTEPKPGAGGRTGEKTNCPTVTAARPAVNEIRQLHGEIMVAAHTTLEKAIRIGELLTGIKASLKHGEWLPWIEINLEFKERTARNYMQCWERREELKSASVADLTGAYRLLAAPADEPDTDSLAPPAKKPPENDPRFVPPPGHGLWASLRFNKRGWWVFIEPTLHEGFYHIAVHSGNDNEENNTGCVEGTKKGIRSDRLDWALNSLFGAIGHGWREALDGNLEALECEPQKYNRWFYHSYEDYLENALGIRKAPAA